MINYYELDVKNEILSHKSTWVMGERKKTVEKTN